MICCTKNIYQGESNDGHNYARLYARAFRATGREDLRRVATGICDWVLRELRHPDDATIRAVYYQDAATGAHAHLPQ